MIQSLEARIQKRWPEFFPGRPPPPHLRVMAMAVGRGERATRILMVFSAAGDAPLLVAKTPRHPDAFEELEREQRLLELIYPTLPPSLRGCIPRSIDSGELLGQRIYLQTALPGKSLKTLLQRGEYPATARQTEEDLTRFEQWLRVFQTLRPPEIDPPDLVIDREWELSPLLSRQLPRLIEARVLTRIQGERMLECAGVLDRSCEKAAESANSELCWVHGDLWPGNLLIADRQWSVLDWDGMAVGQRWVDRVWFAIHYGMLAHGQLLGRPDLAEGMRRTLCMRHPISEVVCDYLRRSCWVPGLEDRAAYWYMVAKLALEAGRVLEGQGRIREFDRRAGFVLREWMGYPEMVLL